MKQEAQPRRGEGAQAPRGRGPQQKGKRLRGLKKKVADIEARIEKLEAQQEERNALLCDPAGFTDDKERFSVLSAMQVAADKLEELNMRWESAAEELEKAEANPR